MNTLEIETTLRDPATLRPHPKVRHLIGRWQATSPDAMALRRSIQERGILCPLLVTEDGQILDGVTRWEAARALQLDAVPCTVRPEDEAIDLVIETETHRRHSTKSQLAFRLVPFIEEAFKLRKAIHIAALKTGQTDHSEVTSLRSKKGLKTVSDYAAELGCSVKLLEQAKELHDLFAKHPEPRGWHPSLMEEIGQPADSVLSFAEYFSTRITDPINPMSLEAALKGLKQKLDMEEKARFWAERGKEYQHAGGRPVEVDKQLSLFRKAWHALSVRQDYWEGWDETTRQTALQAIPEAISGMPEDLLEETARIVRVEQKRRAVSVVAKE